MRGHVKFYNPVRGYGFIRDAAGAEYYVNGKDIESDATIPKLRDGECVDFDVVENKKGKRALRVRVVR